MEHRAVLHAAFALRFLDHPVLALMPFWIWLAFHEVPVANAFAGGALVMGAVIADILGDRCAQRRL
jgi:drug/metabolite transporter (DMT)-like permease